MGLHPVRFTERDKAAEVFVRVLAQGWVIKALLTVRHRKPFDDPGLREELRQRLSKVPGITLPEAKLELRPGFKLSVPFEPTAREVFLEHLAWFFHRANLT